MTTLDEAAAAEYAKWKCGGSYHMLTLAGIDEGAIRLIWENAFRRGANFGMDVARGMIDAAHAKR